MNKPEMKPIVQGETFKTLQVSAKGGMVMPTHYTTKEAVIVVQEGEAILKTPEGNHEFKPGTTFVIPEKMAHSLEVKKDFKAVVTMAIDSEIEFQK